ncbi:MAG: DUF896 domain-containing protein [Veillonellaceae bacterium]|jgi:uncharacterized protein YnzC (UPF0291/DUF896 family)|nr:DUF896 domain-containing protein [Veillonellaceae bacterium]
MITPEVIARINELAKKQRENNLTEQEREEQTRLRRLYIDNIKNQIKHQLGPIEISSHSKECSCGCHAKH